MTIKNIIFDLGNVIYDVDVTHMLAAWAKLGIQNPEELYTLKAQTELFDKLERGQIEPTEFFDGLLAHTDLEGVTHDALKDGWNAMLIDSDHDRLNEIKRLNENYRVFLLSNTNIVHHEYIANHLREEYNVADMSDLFEKDYYSYTIGHRKPDHEAFEFVLADSNLNPSETLFIDDLAKNIDAASELGIQTFHASDLKATWDFLKEK